jgi:formate hydrogenlyase transcriptional activator
LNESEAVDRSPSTCVRVLAATNRDLEAAVIAGTFRQDLFYRLNVFPIRVPSLRERKDDIPLLVEYLVERYAKRAGKRISHIKKKTLDLFQGYDWPGNIRELQNVVERALMLCDEETFSVEETWLQRIADAAKLEAGSSLVFMRDSWSRCPAEQLVTAMLEGVWTRANSQWS